MKALIKKKSLSIISKVILKTAEKEANSACIFLGYQPKVPDSLKKIREFR